MLISSYGGDSESENDDNETVSKKLVNPISPEQHVKEKQVLFQYKSLQ